MGLQPVNADSEMAKGLRLSQDLILGHYPMVPISGAIYLGSSGGTWFDDEEDCYWCATIKDLSPEGVRLIEQLNALYGTDCRLITVIDT